MKRPTIPTKVLAAIKATKRRAALVEAMRALWVPLMVLSGVGAVGTLAQEVPDAAVSLVAGGTFLAAAWLFWRAVQMFMPHGELEAKAVLEANASLHELAPLTSHGDRPIGGDQAIWEWHQIQLDQSVQKLTKPVSPKLTRQDGLRVLALALASSICLWQPVSAARMLTFDLSPLVGDGELVADVWAVPPEYTGLPLVRLDPAALQIALPVGSTIHARLDGARGAPSLKVPGAATTMTRARGQAWSGQALLLKSGRISLDRFGARASWHATAIEDRAPLLVSAAPVTIDPKGRLDVAFSASDDYGIKSAALRITAIDPPKSLAGKSIFETAIPLEDSGDPEAEGEGARRVFVDVSQHVLTGLPVSVVLVVKDGLGQETKSAPTRLTLPEVKWKTALGAALQEQRLLILREGRPYRHVPQTFARLFDAAAGVPVRLDLTNPQTGAPANIVQATRLLSATLSSLRDTGLSEAGLLAMQFARERLALAKNLTDAYEVAPVLWDIALSAEQSDQTPAQQRLLAARQALEEALKSGASESQIRELSQELRDAVGERLQELAQQSQGEGDGEGQGQGQAQDQSGAGGEVSSSDIDKMLSELEQSGGSGARRDALDQLAQLGELMDNLEAGQQGSGADGPGGQNRGGQNPLDDAMRAQRDLSDDTAARRNEGSVGEAEDLAQRQDDLANQLAPDGANTAGSGALQPESPQGPEAQLEAGKQQAAQAMRQAAQALREGDLARAQEAQTQAEQALQQAAQAQNAQNGTSGDSDQDPLGRRAPRLDDGRATKVPDQAEKRRARDVREELRRRQADPGRDDQERDYLDRLLK